MSDIAIKFENISKQYRLGEIGTGTLSHDLNRWWHKVRGKEDPYLKVGSVNIRNEKAESEYVWALKDINLEIKQGEVIGIIGKNGAGKSTLLKILSKVTRPTTGIIRTKGRIASLLEVGTGFHQEMTGRENIYLNGAIMGMTRVEIDRKFDEIIDFAGIERYVDTPVKRYSSGMTVRLGFAIAAHLEPEILVVDEVLAVGDADFQRKALGKMHSISQESRRTVIFVSHNMASVKDLCSYAVLLKDGIVKKTGNVEEIINSYMKFNNEIDLAREWKSTDMSIGNDNIKLRKVHSFNCHQKFMNYYLVNEDVGICFEYEITNDIPFFTHGINVYNSQGIHIFSSHDNNEYKHNTIINKGLYCTIVWIPKNLLQTGDYTISFAAMRYNPFTILFHEKDLLRIQVIDSMISSSKNENCNRNFPGIIRPFLKWEQRIKN